MKIEGGKWKQSTESVTHGIWIWNKGFLINDVSLLLVNINYKLNHCNYIYSNKLIDYMLYTCFYI